MPVERALAALRLMRPRQWVKNGFVVAPLFFGERLTAIASYPQVFAALASFCLMSSAVYAFNDICDAQADLQHEKKRLRPIPAGSITRTEAGILSAVLAIFAIVIIYITSHSLDGLFIIITYACINIVYSLGMKHIAVLELFLVSSGFVLRLLAGGIAAKITLSPWIIVATAMISLILTVGKRRSDLIQNNDPSRLRRSLQGYTVEYLDAILAAFAGATLVVFVLFCVSDYAIARYGRMILLTSVPVALGILRFVQVVMVDKGGDSPTDLVLTDKFILLAIGGFVAIFAVLLYV
jgi:4-hydroxybenzoate polyprenyltransferase